MQAERIGQRRASGKHRAPYTANDIGQALGKYGNLCIAPDSVAMPAPVNNVM